MMSIIKKMTITATSRKYINRRMLNSYANLTKFMKIGDQQSIKNENKVIIATIEDVQQIRTKR